MGRWIMRLAMFVWGVSCAEAWGQEVHGGWSGRGAEDLEKAVRAWVELDVGLYRRAVALDEEAVAYERAVKAFEPIYLERRMQKIVEPEKKMGYTAKEEAVYERAVEEPTMCGKLDGVLRRYVAQNVGALERVVGVIAAATETMQEEARGALAASVRELWKAQGGEVRRGQEILYDCIYRRSAPDGSKRGYSVEKTMRTWFAVESKVIDVWLGPVD